jgi:hypothetical protein
MAGRRKQAQQGGRQGGATGRRGRGGAAARRGVVLPGGASAERRLTATEAAAELPTRTVAEIREFCEKFELPFPSGVKKDVVKKVVKLLKALEEKEEQVKRNKEQGRRKRGASGATPVPPASDRRRESPPGGKDPESDDGAAVPPQGKRSKESAPAAVPKVPAGSKVVPKVVPKVSEVEVTPDLPSSSEDVEGEEGENDDGTTASEQAAQADHDELFGGSDDDKDNSLTTRNQPRAKPGALNGKDKGSDTQQLTGALGRKVDDITDCDGGEDDSRATPAGALNGKDKQELTGALGRKGDNTTDRDGGDVTSPLASHDEQPAQELGDGAGDDQEIDEVAVSAGEENSGDSASVGAGDDQEIDEVAVSAGEENSGDSASVGAGFGDGNPEEGNSVPDPEDDAVRVNSSSEDDDADGRFGFCKCAGAGCLATAGTTCGAVQNYRDCVRAAGSRPAFSLWETEGDQCSNFARGLIQIGRGVGRPCGQPLGPRDANYCGGCKKCPCAISTHFHGRSVCNWPRADRAFCSRCYSHRWRDSKKAGKPPDSNRWRDSKKAGKPPDTKNSKLARDRAQRDGARRKKRRHDDSASNASSTGKEHRRSSSAAHKRRKGERHDDRDDRETEPDAPASEAEALAALFVSTEHIAALLGMSLGGCTHVLAAQQQGDTGTACACPRFVCLRGEESKMVCVTCGHRALDHQA